MLESLINFLSSSPPGLAVFIIAATPIAEVRASLPLALEFYHLSWVSALFWSLLGNILSTWVFYLLLEKIHQGCERFLPFTRPFFTWLFKRTRDKFTLQYEKYGAAALVIFIGIPLPFTGAYTGAVAAYLFGFPRARSLIYLGLGVAMATGIVSAILLGILSLPRTILPL